MVPGVGLVWTCGPLLQALLSAAEGPPPDPPSTPFLATGLRSLGVPNDKRQDYIDSLRHPNAADGAEYDFARAEPHFSHT
jgi:hypothetical protein